MSLAHPRFDEPCFTVDAEKYFMEHPPALRALERLDRDHPLPSLGEPDAPRVLAAIDEPLVSVAHRRIRTLSNYWHAGWQEAIPGTYVRHSVMMRLGGVASRLPEPWGLAVFDAWRPIELQQQLFDAAYEDPETEPGFMAPVSHDQRTPPPHYTGGAVDLTLTYKGTPLGLGTGFDDTTSAAHTESLEAEPTVARTLRRVLYEIMSEAQFVVYAYEWWHFEYGTSRWAAITGNDPLYGPAGS